MAVFSYFTYLFLRTLFALVRALPESWCYALGRALGAGAFSLSPRLRRVAAGNLRQAFGGSKTEEEHRKLVRAAFRHFGLLAVEMVIAPKFLRSARWRERITYEDAPELKRHLEAGRGLLVVAPHLGNWEVLGLSTALAGLPFHVLARPLKNPYLDAYLRRERESTGGQTLPRRGGFRELVSALAGGGVVAIFPDQNQRKRPIFVDWFGRKAATDRSPGFFALRFGSPAVGLALLREGGRFRFRSRAVPVSFPPATGDRERDLLAYTEAIHRTMEGMIREAPEQYFWLHDRYRTRPGEEEPEEAERAAEEV